jgi:chondroitin AC lyase
LLLSVAGLKADELQKVRKQFVEFHVQQSFSETAVARYLKHIGPDGTWADVDYTSQRRGGWPTLEHLRRLESMAVAYRTTDSEFFETPELKQAVVNGLDHWIENDYRNPNWWCARIGVPKSMGTAMILMGDDLPDAVLQTAKPILMRSKLGQTGQNKVWNAGNNVMIGLLYDDGKLIKKAVAQIWSELVVTTHEGIQPDWSFHQHGPQQQFGNYGLSFGSSMIMWGRILRATPYALNGDKLEILRNYMLEGPSWVIWKGRMDYSGCGRQNDKGAQQAKARAIIRQLEGIIQIDPEYTSAYKFLLKKPNQLIGFKPFWRSEMGVQRRPDWYASVKMSSKRVIGAETCNSENMQGLHLGDGTLLIYKTGEEYENIQPLWDWKRLPGTTCDQGLKKLTPKGFGGSDFSGVIGDGETGIAAMIYKRNDLEARKAWFFGKNSIICLGAGIKGETKGPVYTSVQQSWRKGPVTEGKSWVHHAGIGYHSLDQMKLKTGLVEGDWLSVFPTRGGRPVEGELFSLWIDHGKSPKNQQVAYVVFPNCNASEMDDVVRSYGTILANSPAVQAVEVGRTVYAVFYEAGLLDMGKRGKVEVDGPCLLSMKEGQLIAADPTHRLQTLEVKVNGKSYRLNLPQGAELGKQVDVK